MISLSREERFVTGSRRGVKVGHFSWGQLERVRSLLTKFILIILVIWNVFFLLPRYFVIYKRNRILQGFKIHPWCCYVWPKKPMPIEITTRFVLTKLQFVPTGIKLHLWHCCVWLRGLLPSYCQRELAEVQECQEDNTGVGFCFSLWFKLWDLAYDI